MNESPSLDGLPPGECPGGLTGLSSNATGGNSGNGPYSHQTNVSHKLEHSNIVIDDLCCVIALRCATVLCPPLPCATLRQLRNIATMAPPCAR